MSVLARILYLDIETAPSKVYAWGLFRQNIPIEMIIEPSRILGVAYKWDHEKDVKWVSEFHDGGQHDMLQKVWDLLDEADVVIGFNSQGFDIPWIEGELIAAKFPPPSPFLQIDLYRAVKKHSNYVSKRLGWVVEQLFGGRKMSPGGFKTWRGCDEGDEKSWDRMRRYAMQDVRVLPRLYTMLRPWIVGGPNIALIDGNEHLSCPKCGSDRVVRRGVRHTNTSTYPRFRCKSCKGWFRGVSRIRTTPGRGS